MIKNSHSEFYSSLKDSNLYNDELYNEKLNENKSLIEESLKNNTVYFSDVYIESSQEVYLRGSLFSYEKSISHNEEYFLSNNENFSYDNEIFLIDGIDKNKENFLLPVSRKRRKEYFYNIKNDDLSLLLFRENWMDMVSDITKTPSIHDACNISLYIMMHFYKKNYLSLENSINTINMDLIPRRSMVIILRYTRIARKKISNWISFRDKCIQELNKRGEDPRKVLKDMVDEK